MLARLLALDRAVFLILNHDLVRYHLDAPMQLLSRAGAGGAVWFAILFLVFVFGGRTGRRLAITGAIAIAVAALVSDEILKGLVQRPRPFDPTQLGHQARVLGAAASGFSFPSGHASISFAAAAVLRRLGRGWAWLGWVLAALISFSRVYVGAHFPLDVLGGLAVGLFSAWLAVRLLGDPTARRRRARR
jgi:undecaprenyl-diphosphatase